MRLVTPQTVATQLAISLATVYRMAADGELPVACRIGPRIRFDQDAIDTWIKQGGSRQDAR